MVLRWKRMRFDRRHALTTAFTAVDTRIRRRDARLMDGVVFRTALLAQKLRVFIKSHFILLSTAFDESFVRPQRALSYAELGNKAGYSERTIRNFISGRPTRAKTTRDICEAVGIDFLEGKKLISATDEAHGQYTRDQVKDYAGLFFAYRRSFDVHSFLIRSIFEFLWAENLNCLTFQEHHTYYSKRLGKQVIYDQNGEVFISNSIGLVHLITRTSGAIRLITLTRLHHDDHVMSGAVLTQMEKPGSFFQPSSSPIYLRKAETTDLNELKRTIGPVEPGGADYTAVNERLLRIQKDVVNFSLG